VVLGLPANGYSADCNLIVRAPSKMAMDSQPSLARSANVEFFQLGVAISSL
jgi:hypothetical protein